MLLGATGLVGGELLRLLLADRTVGRVVALARRTVTPPKGTSPEQLRKLDARVVDVERLDAAADAFNGVEQIFCALGTTIRQAGSQDRFRQIDHDVPVAAARLGMQLGARHFLLVSALGADPSSRIFYNRVKGEVERDIAALGYRSVTVVRPSLLLGERSEFRLGEELAKRLRWLIPGKWSPVQAADVAAALVAQGARDDSGVRIIESRDIPRTSRQ
jgi:uncharacterized protein YbjT (DUF2867 family)